MIEWIEDSETNRQEFAAFRRIYDASLLAADTRTAAKAKPKSKWWTKAAGIAAALAIVAGIALWRTPEPEPVQAPAPLLSQTLSTPIGHQSRTILSDGTVVWLNSGSELTFTETAGIERRVKLKGEAYLEVAHDPERPFIVETSEIKVKVLGTRFNVSAYDSAQSVVLLEGSVAVRDNAEQNTVKIVPNEMYTFDATTGERAVKPVDAEKYASWIEGCLLLEKTPLNEVLIRLQQYFGVKIIFDTEQSNWIPISGKLELRNGIETALNHLKLLAPITYTSENEGEITIRKK